MLYSKKLNSVKQLNKEIKVMLFIFISAHLNHNNMSITEKVIFLILQFNFSIKLRRVYNIIISQ